MSYQVFARKWRPQVFEDVVGQSHITKTLQNAIATNRLAHAFLFSGPRGVGKTTTARILAKALNPGYSALGNGHWTPAIIASSAMRSPRSSATVD